MEMQISSTYDPLSVSGLSVSVSHAEDGAEEKKIVSARQLSQLNKCTRQNLIFKG